MDSKLPYRLVSTAIIVLVSMLAACARIPVTEALAVPGSFPLVVFESHIYPIARFEPLELESLPVKFRVWTHHRRDPLLVPEPELLEPIDLLTRYRVVLECRSGGRWQAGADFAVNDRGILTRCSPSQGWVYPSPEALRFQIIDIISKEFQS